MSKSLNLMLGVGAGVGLTLLGAYTVADRMVAQGPSNLRTLTALPAPDPEAEAPEQVAEGFGRRDRHGCARRGARSAGRRRRGRRTCCSGSGRRRAG